MSSSDPIAKVVEEVTVKSLNLKPIGDEVKEFFAARSISVKTLERNRVMQKTRDGDILIAFTYWEREELVTCKYRWCLTKKFIQDSKTSKARRIFYGVNDIEQASEIIIVEGEPDKLAMEEAGFLNCVSIPDGAPDSVNSKGVPPQSKDKAFKYLWNSIDCFKKASRIVLATDGDVCGHALAEELARRLGKERCWRVKWPKKSEDKYFKDANEVLISKGPHLLKEAVLNAEPYPLL